MRAYGRYISLMIAVILCALVMGVLLPQVDAASAASMAENKVSVLSGGTDIETLNPKVHPCADQGHSCYLDFPPGITASGQVHLGKIGWNFEGNGHTTMRPIRRYIRTTSHVLNVRTGPGVGNTRIGQVPRGTTAPALETQSGWHRIIFDTTQEGWVSGAHIESPAVSPSEPTVTASKKDGSKKKNDDAASQKNADVSKNDDGTSVSQYLQGKTIVVDPGHGGHDPGAVGRKLTEKSVALDTSLRLAKLLENTGARVILTRSTDVFITLGNRVNIANNSKADLFISIHANAHNNRAIGGTETYYNSSYRPVDSKRLASVVQQELVRELKLRDIGVKTANFHVIRYTTVPSILVELAFLSNAQEESLLNQAAFRQRSADAILKGIHRYFQ